jgi:hypothetical protein
MDYNIVVMSGMIFLIVCMLLGTIPALLFYLAKKNAKA